MLNVAIDYAANSAQQRAAGVTIQKPNAFCFGMKIDLAYAK